MQLGTSDTKELWQYFSNLSWIFKSFSNAAAAAGAAAAANAFADADADATAYAGDDFTHKIAIFE